MPKVENSDLFPRTLNISSTPVLFFCSSVVHFCKKEACIKLLFSGDVAENDVAVEHYLTEDVTKQMLSFDKFPEEHVHEVCIQFYFNAMKQEKESQARFQMEDLPSRKDENLVGKVLETKEGLPKTFLIATAWI